MCKVSKHFTEAVLYVGKSCEQSNKYASNQECKLNKDGNTISLLVQVKFGVVVQVTETFGKAIQSCVLRHVKDFFLQQSGKLYLDKLYSKNNF